MDEPVNAAITAVHLNDDLTAQRWFEHVCAVYQRESAQADWSRFASALAEGAMAAGVDSHLVEQFVEFMNRHDPTPIETVGRMAELATELPALHRQLATAKTAANAGSDQQRYDESTWYSFLAENAVRWDGTEPSWEHFKTWFVYEAHQRGVAAPATSFTAYVEGQPNKVAAFAEYGVTIAGAAATTGGAAPTAQAAGQHDVAAFPALTSGDSGEWVEYLDAMLTSHGF
jgi:hypothetical protein